MRGPPRARAARVEPHAPIGSAAPQRAATARASAAGSCFDRDARMPRRTPTPPSRRSTRRLFLLTRGYPAGRLRPTRPPRIVLSCGGLAPTPPTERRRVSRIPRCSLLLLSSRENRTALDGRAEARRPSPPPSPARGEGAGARAPCTRSALRPVPEALRKGLGRESIMHTGLMGRTVRQVAAGRADRRGTRRRRPRDRGAAAQAGPRAVGGGLIPASGLRSWASGSPPCAGRRRRPRRGARPRPPRRVRSRGPGGPRG